MIDAAPRAAAAASGVSAASAAIAATTSALRDATAAASAVPHACCGLSVVELVIAPRLMRRSLACSGKRSLRRSIDMGAPCAGSIRLRGDAGLLGNTTLGPDRTHDTPEAEGQHEGSLAPTVRRIG